METKKQKQTHKKTKTQSTETNDIATSNTTPNPDATTAVVAGTVPAVPGSKATPVKLIEQAGNSASLAAMYAVALQARGYTDQDVGQLNADKEAFSKAYEKVQAARKASKDGTAQHRAVVEDGLTFRDEVVAGLRWATLGKPNPMKNPKLLLSKTHQPKKLAVWYRAIANEVENNQAALTARFGQDAVALLATKTQELDASNAAQNTTRPAALEAATQEMHAAQVQLAESIAKLRFAAGMAFARDKEVLKKFVPTWARKSSAGKKGAQGASGSGGSVSGAAGSTSAGSSAAGAPPAGSAPAGTAPAGSAGLVPAGSTSPSSETAALKPAAHADAKSAS